LAERERIKKTGGWVSYDGRVCDVLAVSRAFGDAEFKGEGLNRLMADGVSAKYWTQEFADSTRFSSDPVIATPAVTYTSISESLGDSFIVMATDGLWCAHHLYAGHRIAAFLATHAAS
jgi:protein phosphatase 1A